MRSTTFGGVVSTLVFAAACGSVSADDPIDGAPGGDPDASSSSPDARLLDAGWTNNGLWDVADGLPDQGCAPWFLTDGADPEAPVVVAGAMTMTTNVNAESMYYQHDAEKIARPEETFVLEARVKFVAGAAEVNYRSGIGIGFTIDQQSNVLQMEDGTVFLLESDSVRGPSYDAPTADDFHDYKLELDIANGDITVSRDGVAIFSGAAYPYEFPDMVYFGDATGVARATGEWQRVSHNAHVSGPCP